PTSKTAMRWKSTIPRLKLPWMRTSLVEANPWLARSRNIGPIFHFIEKPEKVSAPRVLVRHPAQSLASTASCDDGIGQRPCPNDRLDISESSIPLHRGRGSA